MVEPAKDGTTGQRDSGSGDGNQAERFADLVRADALQQSFRNLDDFFAVHWLGGATEIRTQDGWIGSVNISSVLSKLNTYDNFLFIKRFSGRLMFK